jgi:Tol biopolymer transport system component
VFSEFGEEADTIWAADPDDPTKRTQLAQVPHALGFGIFPSLSPDGTRLAYTVAATRDFRADLWVLELGSGEASVLASGVDLNATPIWAPDSASAVVRRSGGAEGEIASGELLRVDLAGGVTTLAAQDAALYGVDFAPDGTFYFASLTPGGSDLMRVPAAGGQAEAVTHLSDGFTRDWNLSPDGGQIAYLEQVDIPYRARVLNIHDATVEQVLSGSASVQFSPVWQPTGLLTVGLLDGLSEGNGVAVTLDANGQQHTLHARGRGFDIPLDWSPDAEHLALRGFDDIPGSDTGPSWVYVLGSDGVRHRLSDRSDVVIAGWLEAAP